MYLLHSYIPTKQVHLRQCYFLETQEKGTTKVLNFQYCLEVVPFCYNKLLDVLGT